MVSLTSTTFRKLECLNKAHNRYLLQRRCPEDRQVMPCIPETLLIFGAHMNVKEITTTCWKMYLAKYLAKLSCPSLFVLIMMHQIQSCTLEKRQQHLVGRFEVGNICLSAPSQVHSTW